jgi:hypothetical protein
MTLLLSMSYSEQTMKLGLSITVGLLIGVSFLVMCVCAGTLIGSWVGESVYGNKEPIFETFGGAVLGLGVGAGVGSVLGTWYGKRLNRFFTQRRQ